MMSDLQKITEKKYRELLEGYHKTGARRSGTTFTNRVRTNLSWIDTFAPPQFKKASLLNYRVTKENENMFMASSEYATDFTENTKSGLLLHGTTGVGKTHLAYAIGGHISDKGYWSYFVNWVDLLNRIKKTWNNSSLHESDFKNPVIKSKIVIIDDMGAELTARGEQNWVTELLYDIARNRSEQELPTIITSNLNLDALAERYTERVVSRVIAMCKPVWCAGDDYRVMKEYGK